MRKETSKFKGSGEDMKGIAFLGMFILVIFLAHCASTKEVPVIVKDEQIITATDEGFINDDTWALVGHGISPEHRSALTQMQKEAIAKADASQDARRKAMEMCCQSERRGCDNYMNALASSVSGSDMSFAGDMSARWKKAKVKEFKCMPESNRVACTVMMVIEKKGIKKECGLAIAELAR